MEYKDYYATLGVDKKATADEIKHAYRRLARKFHPDVSKEKNAEEKFKALQEAYEVLKDSEKRSAYDELGNNWKAGQEFRQQQERGRQTHYYHSNDQTGFSEDASGFSDFFSHLFGRGSAAQENFHGFQQRGSDQNAKINISLEEAFHGSSKTIQLQYGEMDETGNVRPSLRTIKVNIPPGTLPGQNLRLTNQGNPGIGGGPAGDLYLEIEVIPHHLFTLQGKDVYLTLPVTPWETALGAQIKVPTLGGTVGMKIAAGSQGGQKMRLKGRGMPVKTEPGDQYVIIQIQVPPVKSDEDKQLYEKMAEQMPFNPRHGWPA